VFFLIDDKIVQSRIVAFNNTTAFNDYDTMIIATLNRTSKEKLQYSGLITFYNAFQNKLLANEYSKGLRKQSGALSLRIKKSITAKTNGCTDWYWVTNYADGRQFNEYLYTTCNDCEEMAYKTLNGCGAGGGGGGEGQTNSIFPASPIDNAIVNYFSPEGEHIKYQYINGIWKIILISLPDIVIKTVRESRPYLIFDWPENNQKVVAEGFVYTYDSESGNWEGVPEELIAQKIEDNIDYTTLDECTKAIMDKLKNSKNNDVTKLIQRFDQQGSIFNIKITADKVTNSNNFAETSQVKGSKLDINVILNKDYINGIGYTSRPTDLSIATTLLHEIIHAYLISATTEYIEGCGLTICAFPTIYNAYVKAKALENSTISQDEHEELIATNYVQIIAETVQELHTGIPVAPKMASQVYIDLAMNGLYGTKYFEKKYPDNPTDIRYAERQRIIKRIHAERTGANFGAILITGTPCE
jgi:hypothetical protein